MSWPKSDAERARERLVERYRETVGKEPGRLPDDHPDAWQWDYRGTKAEREELAERFGWMEEEPPPVIEGQTDLFGEAA